MCRPHTDSSWISTSFLSFCIQTLQQLHAGLRHASPSSRKKERRCIYFSLMEARFSDKGDGKHYGNQRGYKELLNRPLLQLQMQLPLCALPPPNTPSVTMIPISEKCGTDHLCYCGSVMIILLHSPERREMVFFLK